MRLEDSLVTDPEELEALDNNCEKLEDYTSTSIKRIEESLVGGDEYNSALPQS